jgi:hypothetical protein
MNQGVIMRSLRITVFFLSFLTFNASAVNAQYDALDYDFNEYEDYDFYLGNDREDVEYDDIEVDDDTFGYDDLADEDVETELDDEFMEDELIDEDEYIGYDEEPGSADIDTGPFSDDDVFVIE